MMTSISIGQSQRNKETGEPDDATSIKSGSEGGWWKRPAMDLARSLPSGDPQECADRIRQLYETVGGFGMLLAITQDSDNPEWDQRSLQLLSAEV